MSSGASRSARVAQQDGRGGGLISIIAFRALPGRDADLAAVLRDRVAILRGLGLMTARPVINALTAAGERVQVSEWAGQTAIDRAHQLPEVLALWDRFESCSTALRLSELSEARDEVYATFITEAGLGD